MFILSLTQLVWFGILLLVASKVFAPKATAVVEAKATKIRKALSRIVFITSIAAFVAALIVWLFAPGGSTSFSAENIKSLNETITSYKEKLEYSWIVVVLFLVTAILAVRAGRLDMKSARITELRWTIKSAAGAKLIVGILAACSFVASGMVSGVESGKKQAEEVEQSLRDLQLAVFQRIEAVVEQEAAAALLQNAEQANPSVTTLYGAYNQVAPFLPDAHAISNAKTSVDIAATATLPDISTDQANALLETYGKEPSADERKDTLVNDVVGLVFDEKVTDTIKKHLLGIENPLLGELVSAFIDPIVAEPIKKAISEKASDAISGKWSRAELRKALDPIVATNTATIASHFSHAAAAAGQTGQSLGNPVWDDVREELRQAVLRGLQHKDEATVAGAKEVVNRFASVWAGAGALLVTPSVREQLGEQIFASYLLQTPDYSALWGYAVIALTPAEYKGALRDLSVRDLESSKAGKRKIELVRELSAQRDSTKPPTDDTEFLDAIMAPFAGIPPAQVTNHQIAQSFIAVHGSFPVDGYRLYFSKTKATPLATATEYFRGDAVSTYVGKYCPAGG